MSKDLGGTLAALRRAAGLSQRELAGELERRGFSVTNQAVSKWEKGATQPSAAQFLALCQVLGVEDVLGTFTGVHTGLLRGLNAEGRKKAAEYAELLRLSGLYAKGAVSGGETGHQGRVLPLYSLAVSAGTGQFLDSSDYEQVEVGPEVPLRANFAVRIAGDSMEPAFQDGQVVWVHQQQTLENGEIGIFLYDDNAYLKKLHLQNGEMRLVSLNSAYGDIPIRDAGRFRVLGKVVG